MDAFEKRLDDTLERLSDLIDQLAESESADDVKQAIVASSQLARIMERVAEARREHEPRPEPDDNDIDQRAMLESLRGLVNTWAPRMGWVRE